VIQFPDYVHAIHEDRRRSYEAAAGRAAIKSNGQNRRWNVRRVQSRRAGQRRFGVRRTHTSGGFGERARKGAPSDRHDIFLSDDYPPEWDYRLYSEQYLLAAFLLGGHRGYEVVLPSWYAAHHLKLAAIVAPLFERPGLEEVERHGSAFWLERSG
jgi:hypothetical protein